MTCSCTHAESITVPWPGSCAIEGDGAGNRRLLENDKQLKGNINGAHTITYHFI